MAEVKDNIRQGPGGSWSKAGAVRCEKCGMDIG